MVVVGRYVAKKKKKMSFKTNVFAEENDRNCECKQGSQRLCRRPLYMCLTLIGKRRREREGKKGGWFPWIEAPAICSWYLSRALHPSPSSNIEMEAWRSLVWYSEVEFSCCLSRSYRQEITQKRKGVTKETTDLKEESRARNTFFQRYPLVDS